MKALFVILFLLGGLVSTEAYAGSSNNNPQQQEQKKTVKPKYDFNLFKFFSIPLQQSSDSLKVSPKTNNKTVLLTKKEILYIISKYNS